MRTVDQVPGLVPSFDVTVYIVLDHFGRKAAIEKAEAALEDALRQHNEKVALIERDRGILERRVEDEENVGRN